MSAAVVVLDEPIVRVPSGCCQLPTQVQRQQPAVHVGTCIFRLLLDWLLSMLDAGADCIRALADALAYLRGRDGGTPPATVGPPEADAAARRGRENGTDEGDVTFVVSGAACCIAVTEAAVQCMEVQMGTLRQLPRDWHLLLGLLVRATAFE